MEKIKLILDTDIGDDIDDTFALILLSAIQEAEVLGVTTVYRNVKERGAIARATCDTYRKNYDIYYGENNPLKEPIRHFSFDKINEDGTIRIPLLLDNMKVISNEKKDGVDFIIDCVKSNPKEVSILAIGPLTNVATAILKCPEIVKDVKELIIMGGDSTGDYNEWNIRCDPEAADVVLRSGIPIRMIGIDVTKKCIIPENIVEKIENNKAHELLNESLKIWRKNTKKPNPALHDAVALATIFGDYCQFEERNVTVVLDGEDRAKTISGKVGSKVKFATDVYLDKFFEFVDNCLSNACKKNS